MNPRVRAVLIPLIPLALLLLVTAAQHHAAPSFGDRGHGGLITPLGVMLQGADRGLIVALIAVGIALIYRTNNIINFAAAELGLVPATLVVLLVVDHGWPYYPTVIIGLLAAVVVGVVVEFVFVRRFFSAPRLILTVATLGIQQILISAVFLLVVWLASDNPGSLPTPVGGSFQIGLTVFKGDDIAIMVVAPLVLIAFGLFLRFSAFGRAIRAAAERADRASTLGIPVRRLQSVVWVLATVLSYVAVMLYAHNAGGLPRGSPLGPELLLLALAAAVIGRFEHIPTIVLTSVGLGVLNASILYDWPDPIQRDFGLGLVVIVAVLCVRQYRDTRVRSGTVSTWDSTREVRPIPPELRNVPAVKWTRRVLIAVGLIFVVSLPFWMAASSLTLATTIAIYAIVGVSLVIITGWAGQVSLGQVSLMALGAAAAGTATSQYGWDLSIALALGAIVGAVAMVIVGLPAIRAGGLALGITTLALTVAVPYLLNPNLAPWFLADKLPNFTGRSTRIRPSLFGAISVDDNRSYYFLVLLVLVLAIVIARGLRTTRPGRVLIGLRENERAAASFGIGSRGPYITALITSGMLAGIAGALSVEQARQFYIGDFEFFKSLGVFSMVVVGGLGSIGGAIIGAVYFNGITYYVPADVLWLRFLSTGIGLLIVLMLLPGGLGAAFGDLRDGALRWFAKRHGIRVPSLVADTRVEEQVVPVDAPEVIEEGENVMVHP
jgi:branched-chain amino acid transport system permease protein